MSTSARFSERTGRRWFGLWLLCALCAAPAPAAEPAGEGLFADFRTPRGTVTVRLLAEEVPLTVASFVGLAEGTLGPAPRKPFFDGLTFHRVVADFVVQGGCPLGTGEGGPGYRFPDEFRGGLSHDAAGVLSMANAGPGTNGSQFFFTLKPVRRLDFLHAVFGRVVEGLEVLPQIVQGDRMEVRIRRVGAAAEAFRADDARIAELMARTPRARAPLFDDPHGLLPASPPRGRAFQSKLANLERFTGFPLYTRLRARADAGEETALPRDLARAEAEALGLSGDAALVLYLADRDAWALWLGERVAPLLATAGASGPDAEAAFLTAARERAAQTLRELTPTLPPASADDPALRLKLTLDEVLDGLIAHVVHDPATRR